MKESLPACTTCQSNKFVVRDKSAERIGTVAGGTIGAGAACLSMKTGAATGAVIGSIVPGIGSILGVTAGTVAGALLGFLTGSATGSLIGERIDTKIRLQYRCNQCGRSFGG